ncbi:uncharacterized protein [Montipora capricornis]|uniref:uncharacterized protein n=1 Tax=Montipora foliosa TaxID=591990 RepID=UPI0035F1642C
MDAEDALRLLKFTSTVATGIIAGGAVYINIVEHPARMELDDGQSLHKQWRESFDRAKYLMAGTSLLPIVGGIAAFAVDQTKGKPWLITAGLLAFNVPYTTLVIKPRAIDPIYDFHVAGKKAPGEIRDTLDKWNNFHKVRTIVDLSALAWCVYNLVYN